MQQSLVTNSIILGFMDRHRLDKMTFIFKNVTSHNQEWFQKFKNKNEHAIKIIFRFMFAC